MFRYVKRHCVLALLALFISIIISVITTVSVLLERNLIDAIVQGDMESFRKLFWYVFLIILATGIAYYLSALIENKFKTRFEEDLRGDLYNGIMRKGIADFQKQDTAEYLSMMSNDVNTLTTNFSSPIWGLIRGGADILLSLLIMVIYSPFLTGMAILSSILSFLIPQMLTRQIRKRLVEKTVCEAELSLRMKEALNGHDVISAYGVLDKVRIRFLKVNKALEDAIYRLSLLLSMLKNCSQVVGKGIKMLTFVIAGGMAVKGKISIGTVLLFVTLYGFFNGGIMLFSQLVPLLKGSRPIKDKLISIIDDVDDIFVGSIRPSFSREIRVVDLKFRYQEEFPVLTGYDLTICKGEKLALVGASGCGKSTFVKLLSGNYSNYQGEIFYDGVELRQLDVFELRKKVMVIHQKTHLFNDTIRYNICLGESFGKDDFDNALKLSGVDKFLPYITGGLDGNCGEDGANLSGGQKQRIALARALIRGIDFLILDEGVSAIDVATANEIEQELLNMKNLTLLTVTHRIKDGLLEQYDKVLVMEQGKIIHREGES